MNEGSLRIRLIRLHLKSVPVKGLSRNRIGKVYVQLSCETLGQDTRFCQSPALTLNEKGRAAFKSDRTMYDGEADADSTNVVPAKAREGMDFTIRKVPTAGIVRLTLYRNTHLGYRPLAHASLHLDTVEHQDKVGHDKDVDIAWHAGRTGGEESGTLTVKACWVSTQQEEAEMQLMSMQVPLCSLLGIKAGYPCICRMHSTSCVLRKCCRAACAQSVRFLSERMVLLG